MDNRFGILHLSDIHACVNNQVTLQGLVKHLISDIEKVQTEYNVTIKVVCISGDLINSGDNSDEELEIILQDFLQPLMEFLSIDETHIFIVAGNHEIKKRKIVPYIEAGLSSLTSERQIEDFLQNIDLNSIERVAYFDTDFASMFGGKPVWENALGRSYIVTSNSLQIGISCLNSAWRSTGVGFSEKGKLILGRKQVLDGYESIRSTDLKICVTHYPFDWLVDDDKIAIEKCINQYDVILMGHIHESNTKMVTTFNGQTLFDVCGKFDNTSDIYNGYSILAINPYNKACDVILRQHFDFPRNCFDKALCVAEQGLLSVSLGTKDGTLALAYNVSHSIETKFLSFANSYFVSNVTAGKNTTYFDEAFIVPKFRKSSEYERGTRRKGISENKEDDDAITLEAICQGKQSILLLGRKEIGKTTILHYLAKYYLSNFNNIKTVPIVLNAEYIDYSGKNIFVRAVSSFINEYCEDSDSFSQNDIKALLDAGLCTIMIDDLDFTNQKQRDKIEKSIAEYSKNRFIFSKNENITMEYLQRESLFSSFKYESVYICTLTKNQIRAAAVRNLPSDDGSILVDKIMLCFKKTALPKTPFVLSLMLSLCDSIDFTPINEAVIMEQFMELLLEKSSPSEAYTTTYDFHIKEDFLISLVGYMDTQNRFTLSNEEFLSFLINYHKEKGFPSEDTKFETLFFEKGVLVQRNSTITFRYNCMSEYYLAKKASQSHDFLMHILKDRNYLNYPNELLYYSGLNRQNCDIVEALRNDLLADFATLKNLISTFDDYNIGINISFPTETFSKQLTESKLTQDQSDALQDSKDISELYTPSEINKSVTHKKLDSFLQTFLIYGNCLKNLELLPRAEKEQMYKDYMLGLCITLGIFKKATEDYFNREIYEVKQLSEKHPDNEVRRIQSVMQDCLKISIPLVLQNIALENIGTTKLKSIIENTIHDKDSGDFSKFFSVFLFCDLHLSGIQQQLKDYINGTDNKALLTIILVKLFYYYKFRYFGASLDNFLENTLADINVKLNGLSKKHKGNIISELRKQRLSTNVDSL